MADNQKTVKQNEKIIFSIINLLSLCAACESDQTVREEVGLSCSYLVFGHCHGECFGEECVELFKLSENSLFEDLKDQCPMAQSPYQGNFTQNRQDKYDGVKDLVTKVPAELLARPNGLIGCPDCADGGAIYIEIKSGHTIKHWLIDKQQMPDYLIEFVKSVEEKIQFLK